MKKLSFILALTMVLAMFAACGNGSSGSSSASESKESSSQSSSEAKESSSSEEEKKSGPVDLVVVTSYGGDDGGRVFYEAAYKDFEAKTGNTILDNSATADDAWRARVNADFQTGAEPDVLFYFTGPDIDPIVDKVVDIGTIRAEYPDYASHMDDKFMPVSPDGKMYGVPVNGNWEGLFANKKVLADCGLEVPGPDYTWEQFLADCEVIKGKGYTPIAVAIGHVPHYWFEFAIYNHGSPATHATIPGGMDDPLAQNWVDGLNDIKTLYDKGYFPQNTMTAQDSETWQLGYDDKAAFAADGAWKVRGVLDDATSPDDWVVVYVPSIGAERKATDMIAGISMGYMITEKAWNDPEKRDAAVEFVNHMTSTEVVSEISRFRNTALKDGMVAVDDLTPLEKSGMEMANNATGSAFFLGDNLSTDARTYMMENIKNVCSGSMTAEAVVEETLKIHHGG